MATTYHIQSIAGVRPQAFVSKLEVRSIFRGRSRVLGGIPGANSVDYRHTQPKLTTTDSINQPESPKWAGYLHAKH